jgi:subtilisin-like proprotein convertase family protein
VADIRNNVENVFLPLGIGGAMKVRVIGANIAGDGVPGNADTADQDYALVVSNVTGPEKSLAVLVGGAVKVDPAGADAFLDPGEAFTLSLKLDNVGSASATGVSGKLKAPDRNVTITQATSDWPDIAAGKAKANARLFKGVVKNSVSCGEVVNLEMAVSTANGSLNVPVALPIGKAGSPQSFASTDVPKSIPDANLVGVSSTVKVTGGGTVDNIDVTIGSLTHTFDGDLTIDLTSPQGTTVRLFNRNGGSGDNLIDTVFSDSAATAIAAGAAPFTGSFIPSAPLSAFKGEKAKGTWTLTVIDNVASDVGTLNSWSLAITNPNTCS